jgi:hypothetical protein
MPKRIHMSGIDDRGGRLALPLDSGVLCAGAPVLLFPLRSSENKKK